MMRALGVLALLAACGGEGITVEVSVGDTGATAVSVFVAAGPCVPSSTGDQACDEMSTRSSQAYLAGHIYTRDEGTYEAVPARDGRVTLEVRPRGNDRHLLLGYVVGFDTAGTVVGGAFLGTDVDVTGLARLQVTLDPIRLPGLSGQADGALHRAEVWRSPAGEQCLAFEAWDGESTLRYRNFIVPAGDLDCDAKPTGMECDQLWPDEPDGTTSMVSCITTHPRPDGEECVLATRACVSGAQPQACSAADQPPHLCYPSAVCDPVTGCLDDDAEACRAHALATSIIAGTTLGVTCTLNVQAEMGSANVLCNQLLPARSQVDNLSGLQLQGTTCVDAAAIAGLTEATVGPWGDAADVFGVSGEAAGALALDSGSACQLTVAFTGDPGPVGQNTTFLTKVPLSNQHEVLVPVVLRKAKHTPAECTGLLNLSCAVTGPPDPSLAACARSDEF